MLHLHSLGIVTGRTGLTCCGKRVKFQEFALAEDSDCPECRAEAEKRHDVSLRMLEAFEKEHGETDRTRELRKLTSKGPLYRSALIGWA